MQGRIQPKKVRIRLDQIGKSPDPTRSGSRALMNVGLDPTKKGSESTALMNNAESDPTIKGPNPIDPDP